MKTRPRPARPRPYSDDAFAGSAADPVVAVEAEQASDSTTQPTLTKTTTRGFGWTAASRLVIQGVQFGSTIVLARLLTPDDYGLVGIVLVFSGFAWLFSDLGLGAAIIRRLELDERILCTAFWINALAGVVLTAVLASLAVPIADAYDNSKLTGIVLAMSGLFTLQLATVNLAILERRMQFGSVARNEITSTLAYVSVAITLAALGFGPYSLVIGTLAQAVVNSAMMWESTRWVPRHFVDRNSLREIWQYSSHLFGFNVANYWSRNGDNFAVGAAYGASSLGLYSRAYNLMMLPVGQVTNALGRVLFPAFSRLQGNTVRLRSAYLRSVVVMSAVVMPIAVILSAAATPFVIVVYGNRWAGAAPILALLALSSPAQILSGTLGPLYQATSRTKQLFRRGLVTTALTVVAILLGLPFGVRGVAFALLVKFWVALPISAFGVWPAIALGWRSFLRRCAPVFMAGAAMWMVTWAVVHALDDQSRLLQLVAAVAAGVVAYLISLTVTGSWIVAEIRSALPGRTGSGYSAGRHRSA